MNPSQIEFAAAQVCRKYYHLTIPEIKNCLENGVSGDYGIIYDRMDLSVLMDWMAKFDQERNAACAIVHDYEANNRNIYDLFQSEPIKSEMEKAHKIITEKVNKEKTEVPKPTVREISINERAILDFKEHVQQTWDRMMLKRAEGKQTKADRFISYPEYFEHKQRQLFRVDEYQRNKKENI